jgi:hypothetical protein
MTSFEAQSLQVNMVVAQNCQIVVILIQMLAIELQRDVSWVGPIAGIPQPCDLVCALHLPKPLTSVGWAQG